LDDLGHYYFHVGLKLPCSAYCTDSRTYMLFTDRAATDDHSPRKTWKTWKSQEIPKWSVKSQGNWNQFHRTVKLAMTTTFWCYLMCHSAAVMGTIH